MLTVENTTVWLNKFADQIEQHQSYLSELDTPIGDGDHGGNMARGLAAVPAIIQGNQLIYLMCSCLVLVV